MFFQCREFLAGAVATAMLEMDNGWVEVGADELALGQLLRSGPSDSASGGLLLASVTSVTAPS